MSEKVIYEHGGAKVVKNGKTYTASYGGELECDFTEGNAKWNAINHADALHYANYTINLIKE